MKTLASLILAIVLAGCSSTPTQGLWDAQRQASPAPGLSKSPLDPALTCVSGEWSEEKVPRIGIGTIGNSTGIFDYEGVGNYLPLDAGQMFTTALKDAGFRVVLREGSTVQMVEWELNMAAKNLVNDETIRTVFNNQLDQTQEINFRPVVNAVLLGSDLLLVGSVNRLDFDTSSGGLEVYVNGYFAGRRSYSALVGMDLALVDSETTEVIWAETYAKEYIGLENKAGVFKFEGESNLVDVNFGVQSNDPLHAGLQDMVNFAAYDMARTLNRGSDCDKYLDRNHNWSDKDVMRRAKAGAKHVK